MTKKFLALALSVLFAMPCVLRADEVEIQLMEVIGMGTIQGDDPLDNPDKEGDTPTRPNDFRATITGNSLSITNQSNAIPSAQAMVVNASTGGIVLNQQFTTSLLQQIAASGVYVLRIETANGALVGQFVVQ